MQQTENYLAQVNSRKMMHERLRQALLILSLIVVLAVFWGLKLTGITMAGEAFCGKAEHVHTPGCENCTLAEHIHDKTCYSNITLDVETAADWQAVSKALSQSESAAQRVVQVARLQLGYQESVRNFQVDARGVRRGTTRYGQWYGNPYGDWSAMFASFCLSYAGLDDLPANAGVESMRLEWTEAGLYRAEANYAPHVGDLLFLTADGIVANEVAIITAVSNTHITAIQGDVENAVSEVTYPLDSTPVLGYGTVPERRGLTVLAAAPDGATVVAQTTAYTSGMLTKGDTFLIYTVSGDNYYAIDGSGNAVQVYIENDGSIRAATANTDNLLWSFTASGSNYVIRNVGTGRHLHPFYNSGTDNGVTTAGGWTTSVVSSGAGVKFRASAYAKLNNGKTAFEMTRSEWAGAVFQFGVSNRCYVWLDGTNGGLMGLGGSPNTSYSVMSGGTVKLPTEWPSPEKYAYRLRGWYDVTNNRYYAPGEEVVVNGDMVLYADWMAATYDVGQFNSMVADTVSTNNFVTTRMFDYGVLFNLLSERANVTVDASGHTETWYLLTSGNNPYNGQPTLDFVFRDWDRGGEDISYPNGTNDKNNPTTAGNVYPGLYTDQLGQLLFDPDLPVIGKQYIGEGDHLFQLCLDPSDPHYGYYYYNSELNAASYNQSDQRFYVYDYLECTRDSLNSTGEGKYADFLPLNSPYANTNGKIVNTYSYEGVNGEYRGTTHYMYDSKYNTNNNSANNVGTNYWFGMSLDINFFLPHTPGTVLPGGYGNQDLYGNDMHFQFSGDDDVWVLVDGQMVLDLGGVHGLEAGDVNFSTGVVTINGAVNTELSNTLKRIQPGEHTLTLYYLERGSSLSNCAIYFNLAPRFQFSIQKEDVLTRELLNGAQFSVFTDKACTVPAQLWTSSQAYYEGDTARNTFTVVDGSADMWGLISGETYYIKETKGPDALGYGYAKGIICLTIDKDGVATYHVEVEEDADGQLSVGFTVHGIKIDAETQKAFIVATNAPSDMTEPTDVHVRKVWSDGASHAGEYITVYLTVTDPDGMVRRIREAVLSAENNWCYSWTNLPKTYADGTAVIYGVQEAVVPGYVGKVEVVDSFSTDGGSSSNGNAGGGSGGVTSVGRFENGGIYLLYTPYGYLAAANNQLLLESNQQTAQSADTALWVATVDSDGTVTLTNKAGQTLYYEGYAFRASSSPGQYKKLQFADNKLGCFIDHGGWSETQYPVDGDSVVSNITYNHILYSTNNAAEALQITPQQIGGTETEPEPTPTPENDAFFQITNIPVGEAVTSLTVYKRWNPGSSGSAAMYEELSVTVRLLANGEDSGITGVLSLKNGWEYTFADLPIYDSEGNSITYTAEEIWFSDDWIPSYGAIASSGGSIPSYSLIITNTFRTGGPELPATGTAARMLYILCGTSIVLGSLVYGIVSRRKRERRTQ